MFTHTVIVYRARTSVRSADDWLVGDTQAARERCAAKGFDWSGVYRTALVERVGLDEVVEFSWYWLGRELE